jgi:AsmA-like C-terminal region
MAESKPNKSLIGRIFKWTGITFLVLIILIIAAPFIFKDKIVSIVKEQANANLNANVDFGEFDLTLISSFPDFRFKIQKVSVVGVDAFAGDTLASIGELITDINLKSVLSGDQYKINAIIIDKARILGKILPDGKANWDIAKADSTAAAVPTATSEPSKFAMKLNEFKIKNAYIVYDDQQGKMYGKLDDFNYSLNGDFTQDNFVLSNLLEIAKTTFKMDGVPYLSEAKVKFKADLDMDMPKMKFTFKENLLELNELGFGFDGFVEMPDTNIKMDLKFAVKQAQFKSLLSLIPVVYSKDFASVKTSGSLAMDGFAKGTYNAGSMPAFAVNLAVKDAMFKYPSLPKSVNNINIDVHVNNPTGVLDATVIDVNKFHVELAGNPVDLSAHVTTPISDPNLKAGLKGVINLASVKEFVPLEKGDDLNGTIKSDISIAGRMSALEKKDFDNFKAEGSLEIEKMNYKTSTLTYEVLLNSMVLKFTNEYVDLPNFDAKLGKSDIQAKGRIDNFMHYLFKDEALKGGFALTSKMMDLNELMGPPSTETAAATPSAAPTSTDSGAAEVPGNIDFVLDSKIDKILFQNMVIDNLIGNIVVRNSKAEMTNLKMNTLDGTLVVNGFYETTNPKKPTTGLNLVIENFDIQKTFKTFNTVKKIAPAAEYSKGNFSATLQNFNVAMNDKMEPDLNTVKAFGTFKTKKVIVGGFPPFVKLGEALKMDKLKSTEVTDLNLKYRMENGRIILEPFDTKISGVNTNISGSTGIDQTIDYKWKMDVPKSMFGGAASGALDGLLKEANSKAGTNMAVGDKIKVNVGFGGTVMKPTVKTSLKEDTQSAVATVTTAVVNNAIDKAAEEAQKILDEAKAKCDQINAETAAAAEKQKLDGYAEADKLVEQAGNPIAKMAAKKAAEAAKKKVDEKCEKTKADGAAKCEKNMEDAKARAAAKAAESKK